MGADVLEGFIRPQECDAAKTMASQQGDQVSEDVAIIIDYNDSGRVPIW